MSLSLTHVLTVNHVFELMLERCALDSWPAALEKVIPLRKRKGEEEKQEAEEEGAGDDEDGDGMTEDHTTKSR